MLSYSGQFPKISARKRSLQERLLILNVLLGNGREKWRGHLITYRDIELSKGSAYITSQTGKDRQLDFFIYCLTLQAAAWQGSAHSSVPSEPGVQASYGFSVAT